MQNKKGRVFKLKRAVQLVNDASNKSRLVMVVTAKSVSQQIEDVTHAIGQQLSTAHGIPYAPQLGLQMQQAELGPDPLEAAMVHKLEQEMREQQREVFVPNNGLLQQLCQLTGASMDPVSLQPDIVELKKAREVAKEGGDLEGVQYLEYVIALLESSKGGGDGGNAASRERDREYQRRRENLTSGTALLPPQAYICPLTHSEMEDPVLIESGECFERSAIQAWFAADNRVCPVTHMELQSFELKPNTDLREAIDEWRKRNTVIKIQATRPKLASAREEDVEAGLLDVFKLCDERPLNRFWINAEGLIPDIIEVLKSQSRNLRRKTLAALAQLATNNDENKEAIAEAGAIPLAVRSLARDVGESRQGVALLLELSKSPAVCEEIGRAQGSILLLVTMLNSDNANAAKDAQAVLQQLASNDQNVVQMAEANHFKPLAQRLISGSEMARIVMASALSRMGLTDQSRAALAQEGAIPPLVAMITSGKLEAKAAALGALQNLSSRPANRAALIDAGIIPPLLQLLFSVTSVVMSLKEGAAATLANLSMAGSQAGIRFEGDGAILESEETIYQLLSLLNLAGAVIQEHLLRALYGLASPPGAKDVRDRMRLGGAITVLMPFLDFGAEQTQGLRTSAAQLLRVLCLDGMGKEVADNLMEAQCHGLRALVRLLGERESNEERAAAAGIIAGLPLQEAKITTVLMQADAIPLLVSMLNVRTVSGSMRDAVLEAATSALVRFTLPTSVKTQQVVADLGVIPLLVNVLVSGTSASKRKAAQCLGQLSQSSDTLSQPVKARGGCCFSPPPPTYCRIHGGYCDLEKTFCLLEADAVGHLVAVISDKDPLTAEAALVALSTLLPDQGHWEEGVRVIHEARGFERVVQQLSDGTDRSKAKALWMLEKLFQINDYKFEYGSKAQGALIELAQHGSADCKSVAAKILSLLELLHNQSSYF